jgi:cellulase
MILRAVPQPIGEWMAKCPGDSCSKVDATTLDWFCIAQHNFDKDANDWPTEIMTRNGRQWKFFLPNDLPGGESPCPVKRSPRLCASRLISS